MTTNQTIDGVPRELIERAVTAAHIADCPSLRDELRALLDAPEVLVVPLTGPKEWLDSLKPAAQPRGDGVNWKGVANEQKGIIEQQQNLIVSLRRELVESYSVDGKPQREPVERQPDAIIEGVMTSVGITHAIYASTVTLKHGEQVKLYAEQPAPVAVVGDDDPVAWANSKDLIGDGYTHSFTVRSEQPGNGYTDGGVPTPLYLRSGNSIVLPERLDESQYRGTSLLAVRRWNKCLDEVTRLNAK